MNVNTSFRISPATIPGEDGAPGVQYLRDALAHAATCPHESANNRRKDQP